MQVIAVRNVGEALVVGLQAVAENGLLRDSRNGPVRVFETPVATFYEKPKERVLFYPERDANPFFHFMEGLWMIAGRNDVEWISRYNASIANYSDDGVTFHGAYGYRWRKHFGFDQLKTIATMLRLNPEDRRVVLQMWDPKADLGLDGKDFPCNTAAKFRIVDGRLDMTVENRSNDMIWGAYGANAVHFSMLQEFMAAWIGVEVGHYWQFSTNFHSYVSTFEKHEDLLHVPSEDYYTTGKVESFPMVNGDINVWQNELDMFINEGEVMGYTDRFFKRVALPIHRTWRLWKAKEHLAALAAIKECEASDWRKACDEWMVRRLKNV